MKLISTTEYLLLINEEAEIKENNYFVNIIQKELYQHNVKGYNVNKDYLKLVIAYYPLTKETKELDLPLLPDPFEKSIEKIAKDRATILFPKCESDANWRGCVEDFLAGYKAAQSKQLELLKRAIQLASDAENIEEVEEEIIQSLSTQKLPKGFILGKGETIEEQIENGYYE